MSKPTLKIRKVTHKRIVWQGITIRIRYTWKYMTHRGQRNGDTTDHIEICIDRRDAPFCPLTTTGYRSYLLPTRELNRFGGPLAYVNAELRAGARDPKWIKATLKARQLDLFTVL